MQDLRKFGTNGAWVCPVTPFHKHTLQDLSNFDANGAWVCVLDEFVDYVRTEAGTRCVWGR